MDVRSVGLALAGAGAAAQVGGFVLDAAAHGSDPHLAGREGAFTLTNPGHLLVYLGVGLVLAGVALALVGPRLYRAAADHEIRRRLLQLGAPLAAVVLVISTGYVANASSLGSGHDQESAAGPVTGGDEHGDDHGHTGTAHSHTGAAHDASHDGSHGGSAHDASHDGSAADGPAHDASHDGSAHDAELAVAGDGHVHHGTGHATGGADTGHDHTTTTGGGHDHSTMVGGGTGSAHDHGTAGPVADPMAGHDHTHDPGATTGTPTATDPAPGHDHVHDPGTGTTGTPTTTDPAAGHDHTHDPGTGTGTGTQCTNGGHGHGTSTPVVLDQATQALQDTQLAQARAWAVQFPTARDAYNAGYRPVTHYYCGIGAHWMNFNFLLRDGFDPGHPEILLYDADGMDAKLVGVNYYVYQEGSAPEGFAGPNDSWHQHLGLCLKIFAVIGPDSWTPEQCAAAGGVKQRNPDRYWLLHAWVVPGYENPTNVFAPTLPALPPGKWDGDGVHF